VLICNGCCFPNSPVNPLVVGSSPTRPLLPARKVRDPPKALHGHLLGGAGAQELLIAVAAMERGVLPHHASERGRRALRSGLRRGRGPHWCKSQSGDVELVRPWGHECGTYSPQCSVIRHSAGHPTRWRSQRSPDGRLTRDVSDGCVSASGRGPTMFWPPRARARTHRWPRGSIPWSPA
jgi:hypothetical protein